MSEDEDKPYSEQVAKSDGKTTVESRPAESSTEKAATGAPPERGAPTSQGGASEVDSTQVKKSRTDTPPRALKKKAPRSNRKASKARANPSATSKDALTRTEAAKPERKSKRTKTRTNNKRPEKSKPGDQVPAEPTVEQATTAGGEETDYRVMVQSQEDQRVLCERAEQLAGVQQTVGTAAERAVFVRFRLGAKEFYGIPFRYTEEIVANRRLSRVPGTPGFIAGVINVNGELLSVLDLKPMFGIKTDDRTDAVESPIILVSSNGMRLGILTDAIEGSDTYDPSELAPPLASEGITNPGYVQGIHDGRVTMLNLEALLEDPALIIK